MTTAKVTPLSPSEANDLAAGRGAEKHSQFRYAGAAVTIYIVPISASACLVNAHVGEVSESALVELAEAE